MEFILDLEQKQTIREGFIKTTGATEFAVLMVIQAHTDIQLDSAFPSQQTISNLTGLSIATVQRTIKSLEGKGLINRHRTGKRGLTIYSINTVKPVKQQESNSEKKYNNSKDFINQFCKLYFDHYEVNYNPNWSRDGAMVKSKLLGNYTDEQLDAILTVTFRDFPKKWSNRQYPRPTIGAVCTFIANQALAIWQEEQKRQDKLEEVEEMDLDKYFKNQQFL